MIRKAWNFFRNREIPDRRARCTRCGRGWLRSTRTFGPGETPADTDESKFLRPSLTPPCSFRFQGLDKVLPGRRTPGCAKAFARRNAHPEKIHRPIASGVV